MSFAVALVRFVSVPYEITLLSNKIRHDILQSIVSVPYEITLLSNDEITIDADNRVSVPYEITLLSNTAFIIKFILGFQYLMKLHYSQT